MLSFIAIVVVAIIIYCAIYLSIKINVLLVVHDAFVPHVCIYTRSAPSSFSVGISTSPKHKVKCIWKQVALVAHVVLIYLAKKNRLLLVS